MPGEEAFIRAGIFENIRADKKQPRSEDGQTTTHDMYKPPYKKPGEDLAEDLRKGQHQVLKKHDKRRAKEEAELRGAGTNSVEQSAARVATSRQERPQEAARVEEEVLRRYANLGGTGGHAAANEQRMRNAQQRAAVIASTPKKRKERASVTPDASESKLSSLMKSTQASRASRSARKDVNKTPLNRVHENAACDEGTDGHY